MGFTWVCPECQVLNGHTMECSCPPVPSYRESQEAQRRVATEQQAERDRRESIKCRALDEIDDIRVAIDTDFARSMLGRPQVDDIKRSLDKLGTIVTVEL
ncbi:hypothetical protein HOU00_gp182 [Caulobacter phage CcrPW]|uniref:Uncharacterized protein n=1 Tax=Caulobacter phage CcrPW TaxID=2283271 RepID=A0A385EAX7_9CAUD|nr:hypothetical protein HOU00_gp182 [Caulobacter phage CcrPW]AXQ68943.1 hypothetical protein CcrPW_gp404 [Caulobacter phage CcrPW]